MIAIPPRPSGGPSAAALAAAVCGLLASQAMALVNPQLQPVDLCERYAAVVLLKVKTIDDDSRTVTLTLTKCLQGQWSAKTVALDGSKEGLPFEEILFEDIPVVAFVGNRLRGRANKVLLYTGDGRWQAAEIARGGDNARWVWTEDTAEAYTGTFNGRVERLVQLVADFQNGRYYFPATPFLRFKADVAVGKLPGAGQGVALYDIDGDGDLDVYACSPAGNRAFLQTAALKFEDATDRLHLAGVSGVSVSFADVNADGRADLLVDGTVFLQQPDGRFARGTPLPGVKAATVKLATFAEINGDGYPDVLASLVKGGLRVFLNSGRPPYALTDASEAAGLRAAACGPDRTGFVFWGDWNLNGRTDLFYAAARGLVLVQDAQGVFAPVKTFASYDFTSSEGQEGARGGGGFAPLHRLDRYDIITTSDVELILLGNEAGKIVDLTGDGNEITEGTPAMTAVLAEDLNADGLVDLYTLSSRPQPNIFHANRGYGSFMASYKYDDALRAWHAHSRGGGGVAAGDVDGDGTADLLLGGHDGAVTLMLNDSLSLRGPKAHPLLHDKLRQQGAYLTVRLTGKRGVLGAEAVLTDARKRIVARRMIGNKTVSGCRSADAVSLAVLHPGPHRLEVRFSDGRTRALPVDLKSRAHTSVVVSSDK